MADTAACGHQGLAGRCRSGPGGGCMPSPSQRWYPEKGGLSTQRSHLHLGGAGINTPGRGRRLERVKETPVAWKAFQGTEWLEEGAVSPGPVKGAPGISNQPVLSGQ